MKTLLDVKYLTCFFRYQGRFSVRGVGQLSLSHRFDVFGLAAGQQVKYKESACADYMLAKKTKTHDFLLEMK